MQFLKLFSIILVAYFFNTLHAIAQNKLHPVELETKAEEYIAEQNYKKALSIYLVLDSIKPKTIRILYKTGICYLNLNETKNALVFLKQCIGLEEKKIPTLNYYLGRAYQLSHEMDNAIKYYKACIEDAKENNNKTLQSLSEKAEKNILKCENGKLLMSKPVKLDVVNLGPEINTQYPEYAPVISADETELPFTSTRPRPQEKSVDELPTEDVFQSTKQSGLWTKPIPLSSAINTPGHDASIALSPDGQTLFLYRFDEKGETQSTASGNLYTSTLKGKEWTIAKRLDENVNTSGWEPSASITEDGKMLFFASDKPGGFGGTDLYYSKKLSDGSWDSPHNMGKTINTEFDDDCPFIHPDGQTLYFSSKGHINMGGFDVFVSKYTTKTTSWETPENIGYPISTAFDDIHFVISPNAKRIYFSSIREGGYGDMDIYYATIETNETANVLMITGMVTDSISALPIEVSIRTRDNQKKEQEELHLSNSLTGKYTLILNNGKNYDVVFSSPKFGSHYENIDLTKESGYKEIVRNIVIKQHERTVTMLIDDGADHAVNAKISIVNIDSGEEIILTEKTEPTGTYFVKLKEGNYYSIEVSKEGYVFSSMEINVPTQEEEHSDTIVYKLKLQPIKEGATLLLRNVYFASNETVPLISSFPELDRLVTFMKQNPATTIEISAHTDNDGNAEYNLKLSDKRAKGVINYIIGKGISPERLKSVGYGKSKPISEGSTDEEKQKNRRVELKILKFN